jgi:hypothetical protein
LVSSDQIAYDPHALLIFRIISVRGFLATMGQQTNFSKNSYRLTALAQREAAGMEHPASSDYRHSWPIGQIYEMQAADKSGMNLLILSRQVVYL